MKKFLFEIQCFEKSESFDFEESNSQVMYRTSPLMKFLTNRLVTLRIQRRDVLTVLNGPTSACTKLGWTVFEEV
jgi:hypothetical protein